MNKTIGGRNSFHHAYFDIHVAMLANEKSSMYSQHNTKERNRLVEKAYHC